MSVPKGWKEYKLDEIVKEKISYGIVQAGAHVPDGIPYIKSSDIKNNELVALNSLQRTSLEIHHKYIRSAVHSDDIIISLRGNTGACAIIPENFPEANLTQGTARISVLNKHCTRYIYYALLFEKTSAVITQHSKGSTFKEISLESLRKISIFTPSLAEQRKIAAILSTWDKAIDAAHKLLENARQQKKALMQQLLTGKKRLSGFSGEWKFVKSIEIFKPVSIRQRGEESLLAVTQDQGVLPRDMLDRRVVMPEGNTENYKLVIPGNFIISLRSFQGGLEYSSYRGLVSPAYTVLNPSKKVCDKFYKQYFKSHVFIGRLAVAVIGIRDGKQISYDDFSFLKIPHPPIAEQQAIARILSAADEEMQTLSRNVALLREEKRALMQQLLSGKKRVQVET